MRTLCLNLHKDEQPSIAETFLAFSPRVHYRQPGLAFLDVANTAHLFGGEGGLLAEVKKVASDFFPQATAAVADTPAVAQLVSTLRPFQIVPPEQDSSELKSLPLSALIHLEGLISWQEPRAIEEIIDFFYSLGLKQIGDLQRFSLETLRERFGTTGTTLWRRLHGHDRQVISPLLPSEPLTDYVFFDFSVSLLPLLLHATENSLRRLFARLQGRGEFASKILLHLHAEYSGRYHLVEIKPVKASRQLDLYMKLIENKLAEIDLENPVKEFSIEIIGTPEKVQQLDFWEPRERDEDKMQALVSLLNQAEVTTGYLQPQNALLPEDSWGLSAEFAESDLFEDFVEVEGQSFQIKPVYSRSLREAPRPTRLLPEPERLSSSRLKRLKFLSSTPIERLEDGWWQNSRGRDYHLALSPEGQALWIFYDKIEDQYFLQGYFD